MKKLNIIRLINRQPRWESQELISQIQALWGGKQVRIPKTNSQDTELRNRVIFYKLRQREMSASALAAEYRLTISYVYKIARRQAQKIEKTP